MFQLAEVGIQGATSHMLGQNLSKMFDVWFEDENKQKTFVW
jgi:prolyl-tRNA synthetase